MFVPLTNQTISSHAMSVKVWVDPNGVRPVDNFLNKLEIDNENEAQWFVESLLFMMQHGEIGLSGNETTYRPKLSCLYASRTWIIYFLEPPTLFICDQGCGEPWECNVETAFERMLTHEQTTHQQASKKKYATH